jgi:hypothetical protein
MSEPLPVVFIGYRVFCFCCARDKAGAVPTFENSLKSMA